MSAIKLTKIIEDTASIAITSKILKRNVGEQSRSEWRLVPNVNGLQWCLVMYPNGEDEECKDHISAFVQVTGRVEVTMTFAIEGTTIREIEDHFFLKADGIGFSELVSHAYLKPFLRNGSTKLTCDVKFKVDVQPISLKSSLFHSCKHIPTDYEFVVGDSSVKAHKHFLALISPVFHAMFSHDTMEAKSGKLVITDFEFNIVQSAVNFCYGHDLSGESIETIIGVLRFGDKYDTKSITLELGKVASFNISVQSFCAIAHYAYDCSRLSLMAECLNFFKLNNVDIFSTNEFEQLPPNVVLNILRTVYSGKSFGDAIPVTVDEKVLARFDQLFIDAMSLDNFCQFTCHAWSADRIKLQMKCAKFLSEHRVAVTTLDSFTFLEPAIIQAVLRLANAYEFWL